MMEIPITFRDELHFISVTLIHGQKAIVVENVLLDSGSAGTLLDSDIIAQIGILPRNKDVLVYMTGISGREIALEKMIDGISVGEVTVSPFTIQMTRLSADLGFNGILGVDFMLAAKLILDFASVTVTTAA
jgi:hypothetical protein